MDGMIKLRFFRLRTLFDGRPLGGVIEWWRLLPSRLRSCSPRNVCGSVEHDLGITADERAQWTAFSRNVLAQIERISAARQAARNSAVADPARPALKRELIRQTIITPGLLSQAAKDLYVLLTPEQQRLSGEKLLNFHRRLVG